MAVTVHTARMGYRASRDWIDITYQGNKRRIEQRPTDPMGYRTIGYVFAYFSHSSVVSSPRFRAAASDYTAEMRRSYRHYRQAWDLLLSWPRVVLLCMCTDPEHCHRTVLGREILPRLGARYAGEL